MVKRMNYEYMKEQWDSFTPEEREKFIKKMTEARRKALERRGPLPYSEERAEAQRRRWANTPPEERERINQKRRETQLRNAARRRGETL